MEVNINGKSFIKSSFSGPRGRCVGVHMSSNGVEVVNTKRKQPIVHFTYDEWSAFIKGVRAGEFDIEGR